MKSPSAYYLLLVYLFALCKPILPLVQDVVAHTFFEHQHMVTVHKDGGKNHVSKEVGKLAEKETDNNTSTSVKAFDSVPLHLATSIEFQPFIASIIELSHSNCYTVKLSAIPLAIQLPPPRV